MGSFQHSKRSDSKRCTVEVRWDIFIENLTVFFIPKSGRKYSHTNSYNFAMTLISQDDHLTAGAWAACGQYKQKWQTKSGKEMRIFGSPLISLNSDVLERFVLFVFFHVKPLTEEYPYVSSVEEDWVRGTTLSIKVIRRHCLEQSWR